MTAPEIASRVSDSRLVVEGGVWAAAFAVLGQFRPDAVQEVHLDRSLALDLDRTRRIRMIC